ncbi:TetR/AcrR family transcriptional regulator C-terminal domain-containing protein [Actinopolymorpha alba]|uniref:TetR/AcrR family transcriptional regulator C-terminal domain-containing protein n=1 Tax=Actinopolymorpha alba TaxID=533267 RepID=UPI00035DA389|nr:TetR/AcrR family transcriptional regulator C-terminal domain-containing protein [Actinopolymorpha alba]
MVIFAGQGDTRRSMALLWRTPSSGEPRTGPGPKPGLTVDAIVAAAIAVADADGMAGLSMRAVGERLGRTAMALYTYVPNKHELVELMYDQALAELPTSYPMGAGWRAATRSWAEDLWAFYLRHPWMLQVSRARPVLGPHEHTHIETLLRILDGTRLESRVLWRLVGSLVGFVRGAVQVVALSRLAPTMTGVSEEDWWYARSALLGEVAPDFAERFPMITRLENDRALEFDDEGVPYLEQEAREVFEAGLEVLLDGIETTIATAKAKAKGRRSRPGGATTRRTRGASRGGVGRAG